MQAQAGPASQPTFFLEKYITSSLCEMNLCEMNLKRLSLVYEQPLDFY